MIDQGAEFHSASSNAIDGHKLDATIVERATTWALLESLQRPRRSFSHVSRGSDSGSRKKELQRERGPPTIHECASDEVPLLPEANPIGSSKQDMNPPQEHDTVVNRKSLGTERWYGPPPQDHPHGRQHNVICTVVRDRVAMSYVTLTGTRSIDRGKIDH